MTPPSLTIISTPSRYGLGKGAVWQWFTEKHLTEVSSIQHINAGKPEEILHDRVLVMGQNAVNIYMSHSYNLSHIRGSPYKLFNDKPTIATFDLQEAYDFKPDESNDNTIGKSEFSKDRGKTAHSNYLFWIGMDVTKLLSPNFASPITYPDPILYPNCKRLLATLNAIKPDDSLFIDIETDRDSDTLDCIGIKHNNGHTIVIPIYRYDNKLAYSQLETAKILAALSSAMVRARVIAHNAMFDLLYLATHYRLPFGRKIYDTMLAHKRCFPEAEKSLAHCISLWTNQHYHKDEHTISRGRESELQLWNYNAKDIESTALVYKAQLDYLYEPGHEGEDASTTQANSSVYPYLLASIKGVAVDIGRLSQAKIDNERRLVQIRRVIKTLVGDKSFNPDSPKQLIDFFHRKLLYKVQAVTESNQPSLGAKALYKLAISYDNPVIQAILYYRELAKETSMLSFNNHIMPWQSL